MIDIEPQVFSQVAARLRRDFKGIYVTGEYVRTPPSFPAVSIIEMDNAALRRTQTSSEGENHSAIMYEVNIYSNRSAGRKSECRKIAAAIDDEMTLMGFNRTMLEPIPNLADSAIYRVASRYTAVVSKQDIIFRR